MLVIDKRFYILYGNVICCFNRNQFDFLRTLDLLVADKILQNISRYITLP